MLLLIQIFIVHLLACDVSENDPVTSINPGCNYAGICFQHPKKDETLCVCCEPDTQEDGNLCGEHWTCDPENPLEGCVAFFGATCSRVKQHFYLTVGFRAADRDTNAPSDVFCNIVP